MLDPVLGSVAGGLLKGLFGKKKKQTTTTRVDYKYIRDAASAAGFNPLTALRNGGAANATTTSPALSSSQFIGEALGAGVDTLFNRDRVARDLERDQLEVDLMREELRQIQEGSAVVRDRNFGYSIPQANLYSGGQDVSSGRSSVSTGLGGIDQFDGASGPTDVNPNEAPQFTAFGVDFVGSGAFSNGQTYEDAGSEPLSWAMAPFSVAETVGTTFANWRTDRRNRRYFADLYQRGYSPPPLSTHERDVPSNTWFNRRVREPF